jgi:hypothetical protein
VSAIRDSALGDARTLALRVHPQAEVVETRMRTGVWQGPRTGYRCVVGAHELATGADLAELTAALEKLLARRPATDPTDERLPLP